MQENCEISRIKSCNDFRKRDNVARFVKKGCPPLLWRAFQPFGWWARLELGCEGYSVTINKLQGMHQLF